MNLTLNTILVGFALTLLQFLLAIPWALLSFLSREQLDEVRRKPTAPWLMQRLALGLGLCVAAPVVLLTFVQDRDSLEIVGRVYGAVLQLQLIVNFFIFGFLLMLWVWPKGGAVALAAFREGVREWVFWLIVILAAVAMGFSVFLPYFTFGEDYLMVKQLGYDTIMLAAVVFGTLVASLSITEEIEGRTAITVMSKPITRRQFMLGKFAGIILAALFMFGLLGVYFEGTLVAKHWWDKLDPISQVVESETAQPRIGVVATPLWVARTVEGLGLPGQITDVLRGVGQWLAHTLDTLPGLVLCYSQVMVLVGLAVALATRVPLVVNVIAVASVFVLAHLTPVVVYIAGKSQGPQATAGSQLLGFVAGVFDTVLPDLRSFSMDPALLSDAPPPAMLFAQYVGSVTVYGVIYTAIVLLFGLILFEDRDLA